MADETKMTVSPGNAASSPSVISLAASPPTGALKRRKRVVTEGKIFLSAKNMSLFLPVYLAKAREFYGLLSSDFRLELEDNVPEQQNNRPVDGDSWAYSRALRCTDIPAFAVCDPAAQIRINTDGRAVYDGDMRVVGTLIDRAAFWLVSANIDPSFDDLRSLLSRCDEFCTYPRGMTAFQIATELLADSHLALTEVPLHEICKHLLQNSANGRRSVAMTADIGEALRYESTKELQIVYNFSAHSVYSHYFLTGILANERARHEFSNEVTQPFVQALWRALMEIRSQGSKYNETIRSTVQNLVGQDNDDLIDKIIDTLRTEDIYSKDLSLERCGWAHCCATRHLPNSDLLFKDYFSPHWVAQLDHLENTTLLQVLGRREFWAKVFDPSIRLKKWVKRFLADAWAQLKQQPWFVKALGFTVVAGIIAYALWDIASDLLVVRSVVPHL